MIVSYARESPSCDFITCENALDERHRPHANLTGVCRRKTGNDLDDVVGIN